MKEVLYEVRCLKSNEDMILALAGLEWVRALHRHRRGHGFESR